MSGFRAIFPLPCYFKGCFQGSFKGSFEILKICAWGFGRRVKGFALGFIVSGLGFGDYLSLGVPGYYTFNGIFAVRPVRTVPASRRPNS